MVKRNVIDDFSGKYAFLSNFYASPILYSDILYPTNEHFFQAMKTKDFSVREEISLMNYPTQAKKAGGKHGIIKLRSDWEDIKEKVMYQGLKHKFEIQALRIRLLETDDKELIEGNTWNDTEWGVCRGVGENKLGKLLMRLRSKLQEE